MPSNLELLNMLEQKTSEADVPLKETAINLVFGKGNPNAQILFIGEAPGKNEDEQGYPFVGTAGKKLNSFLELINLKLEDIYIANILKYRPPKNRDPNKEEIRTHAPFLIEQIKIIKPKIIATLGNFATKFIVGNLTVEGMKDIPGITEIHGQLKEIKIENQICHVMPLFHPAATIYNRKLLPDLEADFQKMGRIINDK